MSTPNETREVRKPRVFKEFDIDELSAVDIPAQQPALIAIRKAKDGEQLSDRIKDPDLSDEEKKKLAAKLNPNYGKSFVDPAVEDLLGDYETARQAFNHPTRHPLLPRQRLGVLAAGMVARRAADELVPGFKQGRRALRTGRKLRDAFLDVTGPQPTGPKVVMPPRYGKSALSVIGGAAHRAIRGTRAFAARLRKPTEPEPMMAPPSAWQGTIKPLSPIRANPAERVPLPKAGDLGSHLRQAGRVAISAAALRQRIFNLSRDAQTLVRAGGGDQRQIRNLQTRLRSLRIAEGGQSGLTPLSDKLAAQYPQFFSVVGKSFTKAESDLFELIRGHERQAELYQNIKADMLAEGRVPSQVIDEAIATAEKHKRELLAGLRDAETALVNARGRQTTRSKLRTLGRAASGLDYDAPGDTRNVRPLSAVWNKLRSSGKFDFIGDDAKAGIPKDLHGFGPVRRVLRGAQFLQGVSRWSRRKGTADAVEEFGPSISRRKLRLFGATALGGAAGKTLEMVGAPRGTAVAGMAAGFAGQGAREIGRIVSRYRELIARNQRYIDEAKRLKVGKSFGKAQDINATAREVDSLIKGLEQRLDRARQAGDQSAIRQLRGRINEAKRIRRGILSDHARYGTVLDEAVRAGGPEKWARKKQAEAGRKADAAARAVIESGGTPEEAKVLQGEIITRAEREVAEKSQAVARYQENRKNFRDLGRIAGALAGGKVGWEAGKQLERLTTNPKYQVATRIGSTILGALTGGWLGGKGGERLHGMMDEDPDSTGRKKVVSKPGTATRFIPASSGTLRIPGIAGGARIAYQENPEMGGRIVRGQRTKYRWNKPSIVRSGRVGALLQAGKRAGSLVRRGKGKERDPELRRAVQRARGDKAAQRRFDRQKVNASKRRDALEKIDELERWTIGPPKGVKGADWHFPSKIENMPYRLIERLRDPNLTNAEYKRIISEINRTNRLRGQDVIKSAAAIARLATRTPGVSARVSDELAFRAAGGSVAARSAGRRTRAGLRTAAAAGKEGAKRGLFGLVESRFAASAPGLSATVGAVEAPGGRLRRLMAEHGKGALLSSRDLGISAGLGAARSLVLTAAHKAIPGFVPAFTALRAAQGVLSKLPRAQQELLVRGAGGWEKLQSPGEQGAVQADGQRSRADARDAPHAQARRAADGEGAQRHPVREANRTSAILPRGSSPGRPRAGRT